MKITSHLTEYHDNIYYALDTTKKFLLPFYYIYFNGVQICEWKSRCNFERIGGVMNLLQCPEKILTFSLLFDIIWHQHWLNFQFASRYFNPSVCSTKKHQNQFHENFKFLSPNLQHKKPERKKFVFYIILTFPGHFYLIFHLCCDKVMKAFHFRTKLLLCFFVILFAWKLDNGTLNKQSRTLMFFMMEQQCWGFSVQHEYFWNGKDNFSTLANFNDFLWKDLFKVEIKLKIKLFGRILLMQMRLNSVRRLKIDF